MLLTDDEQREEYQRRMDQMALNIENMRFDMNVEQKKLAWENKKFLVSAVLALAASIGAGVAFGNYLAHRESPPSAPAQPQQVFVLPPGTIITTPGAPAQK